MGELPRRLRARQLRRRTLRRVVRGWRYVHADFGAVLGTSARVAFGERFGHNYEPRCLRVAVGTTIRFDGPFSLHPVAPGAVVDGVPKGEPLAGNPVAVVEGGGGAEFVATTPGRFGYYCDLHVVEGMMGAIEVVESATETR